MVTTTIYAASGGGYTNSSHDTYSNANSGSSLTATSISGFPWYAGQLYWTGLSNNYHIHQSHLKFDTSSIPDGATITSVLLEVYGSGNVGSYTIDVFNYDCGTLTTADHRTSAALSALTVLASHTPAGGADSYIDFVENGSNFINHINKTGTTVIMLAGSDNATATAPSPDATFNRITYDDPTDTNPPKLTITYNLLQSVSGSISMSGTVSKHITKSFSGSTGTLSGSMISGIAYFRSLTGTMGNLTGTFAIRTNKALSGTVTGTGAVSKHITKSLTGTMGSLVATLNASKVKLASLSGTMGALTGAVTTRQVQFGVNLTGSISSISGSIVRTTSKALSGVLTPAGRVTNLGTFRSAILKAGTIIRRTIKGGSG